MDMRTASTPGLKVNDKILYPIVRIVLLAYMMWSETRLILS